MAKKRKHAPQSVRKLPDREQSQSAVRNSLPSVSSPRSDDYAIRHFLDWYSSEPRLAFNRIVVTRYRIFLEQAHDASSTIDLQLAAVRRLAYRRRRLTQPGPRGRHTPCEGCQEARNSCWQLAPSGARPDSPVDLRSDIPTPQETTPWLPSSLGAACEGPSWRRRKSKTSSNGKVTGCSLI
jgi:hypothetical protein